MFVSVRFGNVLGSAGSVVPLLRRQIAAGGPVTVTHPEMKRYFMTIPEATQLVLALGGSRFARRRCSGNVLSRALRARVVGIAARLCAQVIGLQAAALGKGGEVFILDMGQPVSVLALAQDMIRLSGLEPEKDIEIKFTGIRPGEKLFEELATDEERAVKTSHSKVFVGRVRGAADWEELRRGIGELLAAVDGADERAVYEGLRRLIPEFTGQKAAENGVTESGATESGATENGATENGVISKPARIVAEAN